MLTGIFEHLEANGMTVHFPQQKPDTKSSYVVIYDGGGNRIAGRTQGAFTLLEIECHVPGEKYSALEALVGSVETAMSTTNYKNTGFKSKAMYDDGTKTHFITLRFQNTRTI